MGIYKEKIGNTMRALFEFLKFEGDPYLHYVNVLPRSETIHVILILNGEPVNLAELKWSLKQWTLEEKCELSIGIEDRCLVVQLKGQVKELE